MLWDAIYAVAVRPENATEALPPEEDLMKRLNPDIGFKAGESLNAWKHEIKK